MNLGALIIGIGFSCIAILDLLGCKIHIREKFWDYKNIRVWQKKRMIAEIVLSLGAWTIFFSKENYILGGAILSLGFVLLFLIDFKFKKED